MVRFIEIVAQLFWILFQVLFIISFFTIVVSGLVMLILGK